MAMNAKEFKEALEMIEAAKGIKQEVIIAALKEALIKGFKKQLGADDAIVEVDIDIENGISMYNIKHIVKEVEDDVLEIELADAKAYNSNYKIGDDCKIPASVDDMKKQTAMSIKSIWKQKFAEAEKEVVRANFADKMQTMVTGRVERSDDKGVTINIGRNTVYLPRSKMIGDESFLPGDTIRIYVAGVDSEGKNGARVDVTRADEGFLRCLFNEEIREIYDGTISIKAIARQAGEKSKVAVYSSNPDVDPAGSCIGQNGSRIQKIVSQLGNGNANKEKIDIIAWSENPGLYVMEALKPARIAGVSFDAETKKATAIVEDDSLTTAIGRKGVNVRLAAKLTQLKIDVIKKSDALEQGIEYQTFEELNAEEIERREKAKEEARLAQYQAFKASTEVLPGLPDGYVAPQERVYEDEKNDFDEVLETKVEEEVVLESASVIETVKEEPKAEEKPAEDVKTVKTTITLSELEKTLEDDKKGSKQSGRKSYNKKKNKDEEEDEATPVISRDPSQNMSIYTEEELREIEAEESEDDYEEDEEDVDYDEYDDYYDDNK